MTFVQAIHPQASANRSRVEGVTAPARHAAAVEPLVPLQDYENIDVSYDPAMLTYWCHMRTPGKPIVTNGLLRDLRHMQDALTDSHARAPLPVGYFVFASKAPGVFSLGGDLQYFAECVELGRSRQPASLCAHLHRHRLPQC